MKTKHASTAELVAAICNDPSASHWLKDALTALLKRDPVDAVNDAELLADIMRSRLSEMEFPPVAHSDVRRHLE
jgi:hypothetical protein